MFVKFFSEIITKIPSMLLQERPLRLSQRFILKMTILFPVS